MDEVQRAVADGDALGAEALQREENLFEPARVRSEEKLLQCWN